MSISTAQSKINQAQRDIQALNKRLSEIANNEASKMAKIASVSKSITRNTSASQLQNKSRETQRVQDDIVKLQRKRAQLSKDLTRATEKLHSAQQELSKEQEKEQKRHLDQIASQSRASEARLLDRLHRSVAPPLISQSINATTKFDAFISHATEDKDDLVRPLAEALINAGYKIWYDEFQLKVGDSLRRSIDRGLAASRFGIVILSPSFFAKQWPQYELDGLVSKEMEGGKVILPIWHKVSKTEVMSYSPSLADKMALNTVTNTIEELAISLADVLKNT
ncbi:MAG: toll/interleukin-1 receptor domain-containing protein [Alphaproteobacteria bacterium]|nr:toll/interleukin-1 receptor domain-containing protein [Alphaproteobacteria bacterium]